MLLFVIRRIHDVVKDWQARGKLEYIEITSLKVLKNSEGSNGYDSDEELDHLFDQAVEF